MAKGYLIIDTVFKRAYIDKERNSYLFINRFKATQEFSNNTKNTSYEEVNIKELSQIFSKCYASGASNIIINRKEGIERIEISEKMLLRRYYNNKLTANLVLFSRTGDTVYLSNMKDCIFIIPIQVRDTGNEISIKYMVSGKERLFIAFSDLEEYKKCGKEVENWEALEVSGITLRRLALGVGCIINPCGKKVTLTDTLLKEIPITN